ncbi:c-type cytochrome [Pseudomonas koreensis]
MRLSVVLAVAPLLFSAGIVLASEDVVGIMAANGCVNCHGSEGRGSDVGNIPPLFGHSREFLVVALNGYKSGSLHGTVMNRVMKDVDEKKIEVLANYFSSIK